MTAAEYQEIMKGSKATKKPSAASPEKKYISTRKAGISLTDLEAALDCVTINKNGINAEYDRDNIRFYTKGKQFEVRVVEIIKETE